jgi:hypothetical protein
MSFILYLNKTVKVRSFLKNRSVRFIFIFFAFVERIVEFPEDHVIADQLEKGVVVGEQHQRLRDQLVPLRRPERG